MSTKAKALRVAKRYGFVLDESVSGLVGDCFTVCLDHPTHSIAGDCRSITESNFGGGGQTAAQCAWADTIERMEEEGPLLERCEDPECEYHSKGE